MGVFTRPDSAYYFLYLEGYKSKTGGLLREKTKIRCDATVPKERKANRDLAEQRYHQRMTELATGSLKPLEKPAILFADFAAWFAANELPKRRGREREAELLRHLVKFFGSMLVSAISRDRVSEYMTHRLTTPTLIKGKTRTKGREVKAGPSAVNREVDLLKAMLQVAVPTYLDASPIYGMKRMDAPTPMRRVLTEEEEARLLKVMTPTDAAFFLIGQDTLARLSDIIDLKLTDDHGRQFWIADPKTGGGFYAPVSTRLRKALDAMPAPADEQRYLFPARRVARTERDRRNSARQMFERYCREAKVDYGRAKGLTFHWATRRTAASRMLSRGVPLATVQKVGRWKTAAMPLEIYHGLIGDEDRAAIEVISAGKGSGKPSRKKQEKRRPIRKPEKVKVHA